MGELRGVRKPLYRAFKEEKHARDFVSGQIRLSELATYKFIEDSERRDASEGEGHFFDLSNEEWHVGFGWQIYLLCLSEPDVDLEYLRDRFGRWVVQIEDPHTLARDIENGLAAKGLGTFNGVHGRPVQYSKGGRIALPGDLMRRTELSFTQKPNSFGDEKEYRMYTILHARHEELVGAHLEINMARTLDYARLL